MIRPHKTYHNRNGSISASMHDDDAAAAVILSPHKRWQQILPYSPPRVSDGASHPFVRFVLNRYPGTGDLERGSREDLLFYLPLCSILNIPFVCNLDDTARRTSFANGITENNQASTPAGP